MSLQYIHTSARRGLEPGKSGFCCVARDRELPVDLGKELERLSRYEHIAGRSNPVILRHLTLSIRSGDFHILSRLSDAGADYSKRNNHIAHHLAFSEAEIASLPDPATLLLFWKGWRNDWHEPPRVLQERDQFKIHDLDTKTNSRKTDFSSGLNQGQARDKAFTIEEGQELDLALHFHTELLSLPPDRRWEVPFTNFILTSDQPTQFLWRGNWENRPLPFEFETLPEKVEAPEKADPSEPPPKTEPHPEPEEDRDRITKTAPKVEIPEELTRASRKRPKRKWTRKRFSNTLNLSLAILAFLCIATISFLLIDFRDPDDAPPNAFIPEPAAIHAPSTAGSPENGSSVRDNWNSLVQSDQLYEEIAHGLELAAKMAEQGDPEPSRIANALAGLKSELEKGVSPEGKIVPVSSALVQHTGSQWVLEPTVASEIQPLGLVLLNESLFPFFREPFASSPVFDSLRSQVQFDRFNAEDTVLSLKAISRAARDHLAQNSIEAIAAAEAYRDKWQSLSDDEILASIHKLETAFNVDPDKGYLALDSDGLLVSPQKVDLSEYLKALYQQFILSRISSFRTTPEFRDALYAATLDHDTPIERAKTIYQVLSIAEAFPRSLESRLELIRNQWRETFIREDLMEETIINFNLERLANSKRILAELQSQFTSKTLADLDFSNEIQNSVKLAEQIIQAIGPDSTWGLYARSQ